MRDALRRAVEPGALVLAVCLCVWIAATWALRLTYPYDLEWMEGGMLSHAWRMRQELPLYVRPGPDFAPFIYPPGYPAVVAGLASATGLAPWLGRGVSILGSVVAAAMITQTLWRRGAPKFLSLGCGAVFLGTYAASGAFMDLVRPDGLFIGLLAASVGLALDGRRGTVVASALLLVASFLVKHNAAAFGLPMLLGLWLRDRRSAWIFVAVSVVPALSVVGYLQWRTGGLFLVYLLKVPASHPVLWPRLWPGTLHELGTGLAIAVAGSALWALWRQASDRVRPAANVGIPVGLGMLAVTQGIFFPLDTSVAIYGHASGLAIFGVTVWLVVGVVRVFQARANPLNADDVLVAGVALMALGLAGVMRAHNGGYINVHMHLFWAGALGMGWTLRHASRTTAAWVVVLQLLWSLAVFDAPSLRPNKAAREAGDRLVAELATRKGPVLSPYAAWLPTYAGHPPSVHYMALWDLDYQGGPLRKDLTTVNRAVRSHYWPAAVQANRPFPFGLEDAYGHAEKLDLKDKLLPKTGWEVAPTAVLSPK
jgi:hypothetical protein